MSLVLDEDEYFSMQANVTSPGYQSVVLRGFITQQRPDGLYAAPLLPQLFYGASGTQLTSWRQYLPTAGSQTIFSRSGGSPMLPREELYWRKVSDFEEVPVKEEPAKVEVVPLEVPPLLLASILGLIGGTVLILLSRRK